MFEFDPDAILPRAFYEREPHALALDLLGCVLVRQTKAALCAGRIVEVEVYGGGEDPASHSNSGVPTERTEAMFGAPGTAYIYTIYGVHQCLNVVAPADPKASAILIRALEPVAGERTMAFRRGIDEEPPLTERARRNLLSGPGKLCQAMAIDMGLNGHELDEPKLCLVDGDPVPAKFVARTPRIGLNPKTCGESHDWDWRYVDARSDYLSRPLPKEMRP